MNSDIKKSSAELKIQRWRLIIAILTIVITVFFSVRSERSKELTISYIDKRSLVATEGQLPASTLNVTVNGTQLQSPWLLAVRLENTGNQAIEEREIERPPTLHFQGGIIVAANLKQKSHEGMAAALRQTQDELVIEHKLLNPGDWISLEVIFDGEPILPPRASLRISGVSAPIQSILASGPGKQFRDTLLKGVPGPVIYAALALSSITAILVFIAGVSATMKITRKLASSPAKIGSLSLATCDTEFRRAANIARPKSAVGRVIYAAIGEPHAGEILSDAAELAKQVAGIPQMLLDSLGINAEGAATLMQRELKEAIRDGIAFQLYVNLPIGPDSQIRSEFEAIDVTGLSVSEIFQRGEDMVRRLAQKTPRLSAVVFGELFGVVLTFLAGLALAMVTLVGWRIMI